MSVNKNINQLHITHARATKYPALSTKYFFVRSVSLSLFLLFFAVAAHAQTSIDRVVAKVGDKIILHSDIQAQIKEAKKDGSEVGPDAYCTILEELLFQKLLTYQAQLDSIEVTEQEVEADLDARFNYFIQQGGGSREEFEKFMGKTIGQMKDEFREHTRERILAQRMQQSITKDVNVTPKEVKEFYARIPEDSLPYMGSKVEFAQIAIVPKISEAEKKQMYKQLEEIRINVLSGEMSFCTGAALYSCDPGSKDNCGEFDFVSRGTFVPEFDATAFSMKENEVSEIFETQFGYHILQLLERRGDMYRGRHILICFQPSEANLQKAAKRLDSVYTAIKAGTITFEKAVEKFSNDETTKYNQGKAINEYTGDSRYDVRDLDKQTFIVIDPLMPNEITRPAVFVNSSQSQGVRIVKLLSRTEPHRASLEKDYPDISDAALTDKKNKVVLAWIKAKVKSIYLYIDEEHKKCRFQNPWLDGAN